jgi:hypothetical protein
MPITVFKNKRSLATSRDVLLSGEAQWNLKLIDIIRNGVLYPWRYVTTVYAIKLGNNIILATRTLHSFIPLLLVLVRAGCVPDPLVRKTLDLH